MKKIGLVATIVILLVLLIVVKLFIIPTANPQIIFSENNIDTIPIKHNKFGGIITNLRIGNDTIEFIIDTGAESSLINPTVIKSKSAYQLKNSVSKKITDIRGYVKNLKEIIIKEMEWGSIKIKNYPVFAYEKVDVNLIGNDLLSNFCVKFDNEHQRIILSKNSALIPKKGIPIPFSQKGYLVSVPVVLSKATNKSIYFILDTGYECEFSLKDSTYQLLKLPDNKERKWVSCIGSTLFSLETPHAKDSTTYAFTDFKIGKKLFKNVIIENPQTKKKSNLIGSIFMSRFSSFTIDYPNQMIYIELPKDYVNQDGVNIKFSGNEITDVSVTYLNILYHRINSLGFSISHNPPYKIDAFSCKYKEKIHIGDTLVGVDNVIFYKDAYDKYINRKSNFKLVDSINKQNNILSKILNCKTSADLYFLNNKKLIKLSVTRDTLLNPPPQIVYSCYDAKIQFPYFAFTSITTQKDGKTFGIYYPWSTLTNKEIKIESYYDNKGKKHILTNKLE